jgi:anti-sigma regulatory factor (Ser/Thr protein kinase)
MQPSIRAAIEALFVSHETITSGQVAKTAGVSRQAAHYHLKELERQGDIIHEGAGRGGRYRRRASRQAEYSLRGLKEHEVWGEEWLALRQMDLGVFDNPKVKAILNFAFTEMVNNAIDHSAGDTLKVRWFFGAEEIAFEVEDDGVGAFRRMRETRGLDSEFEAIGEISKGKQTSDPTRHSGLGIYFSSRMVNAFVIASGHLIWTVDNRREDEAVGWIQDERHGTRVRCEIDANTEVTLNEVFDSISDPEKPGVNRTTIRVSLFQDGGGFISRTEAKRIGARLESYGTVELDFEGIESVGQGFVDELFRVWQADHLQTRLVPVRANPSIISMIGMSDPDAIRRSL